MNLSKKLLLNAILPMLIILLSGGFSLWQTTRTLENFNTASDIYDANVRMALEMQVDFKEEVHQWKNVLLRGSNPPDLQKHWAIYERLQKEIEGDGASLVIALGDSGSAPMIQDFLVLHRKMGEAYRNSLNIFLRNNYNIHQADYIIRGVDVKPSERLNAAVELISEESSDYSQKTIAEAWRTAITSFLGMLVTLVIASFLFRASMKRIVLRPVGLLANFARHFSAGDYSRRMHFKSDDEFGMLTDTFNRASGKIESLVANLEWSKERHHNLIQGIDAIIWEFNPHTDKYTFVSQRAEELLGYPLSAWLGEPGFLKTYCHPDDLALCQETIVRTLGSGTSGEYICRAITDKGDLVWLNHRIKLVRDDHTNTSSILGVMVDITRMKQYEDRMAYLASHDELTGLANRNMLTDRLERAVAHARGAGNITALLQVNIDRFRLVNESLGHQLGDEVIKSVARRLQQIIGTDDTLAHFSADDFAIVLRDIVKPEDIAETSREILRLISMPLEIGGNTLTMNCSIGISMYPKDGGNGAALLKNAGSALSRVKQQGKNNYRFYSEDMNAMALASLQLENKMRRAIEKGEFALYYQPQISIAQNRMIGVEALIRWIPPGESMISPMDFIPLAEETNLIQPIGAWVLREACRQNRAWQDRGFMPFCVAVNLSARQFSQPDIIQLVTQTLDETGLDPQYLELEITESVMMNDVDLVIRNLEALHNLGVKLAVDDFGTGYSSLSYLKRLPIDKLKVDKSFVQHVPVNSDDKAIVAAIIAMAHNLKLTVIAEGVETEDQLHYLRGKKCDEIQGYYFSRPLSADALEKLLVHPTVP